MGVFSDWREPMTQAFALRQFPSNHADDNGVLFTAIATVLGIVGPMEFFEVATRYESSPGILLRYPGSPDFMSYDDHLAAVVCYPGPIIAGRVTKAMERASWTLPDGNFLGRFPLFVWSCYAAIGELTFWESIIAGVPYLLNLLEAREETSGKQLLWLAQHVLKGQSKILDFILVIWRARMMSLYPRGLQDLFAIYYTNPFHPFHSFAPRNFDAL